MIDLPFNLSFTWFDLELIIRLLVAITLSAIIGFERELSHKPADTSGSYDPTRIAAGVVAGISFIGAGSIIALRGDVKGLTTAASLWVAAAIGLIIGLGNYTLPIIATIITYVVLRLDRLEKNRLNRKSYYFQRLKRK